jgi:hypothetical protein
MNGQTRWSERGWESKQSDVLTPGAGLTIHTLVVFIGIITERTNEKLKDINTGRCACKERSQRDELICSLFLFLIFFLLLLPYQFDGVTIRHFLPLQSGPSAFKGCVYV